MQEHKGQGYTMEQLRNLYYEKKGTPVPAIRRSVQATRGPMLKFSDLSSKGMSKGTFADKAKAYCGSYTVDKECPKPSCKWLNKKCIINAGAKAVETTIYHDHIARRTANQYRKLKAINAMQRDVEQEGDETDPFGYNSKFEGPLYIALENSLRDDKYITSVQIDGFDSLLVFDEPVTEARAIKAMQKLLGEPATKKWYNYYSDTGVKYEDIHDPQTKADLVSGTHLERIDDLGDGVVQFALGN